MTAPEAAWPADVPQTVKQDGFQEKPERNIAEFQPEVGPPKQRRRTSIASDIMPVTIAMTFAEYDTLKEFYRLDLVDGTLTFSRTHPRDPDGPSVTFMFVGDPPTLQARGPDFGDVAMTLRLMP